RTVVVLAPDNGSADPALGRIVVERDTRVAKEAREQPLPIQELAGHQNLQTTLRYMHLSPAAGEGAIRLLDRGRDEAPGISPNPDPKFGDSIPGDLVGC